MTFRRRAGTGLLAGTAALAATVGLVTPAEAAVHECRISGDRTNCAYVTGIDPGSWLQMRTGPGYGYADVAHGRLDNGEEVGLGCWTTGDGAADNPNYRYWIQVDTGIRSGFVNDWYLDTGNAAVWQQRLPHC
ncbi:hypothetical protein ACIPSE_24515 [Streptomyces sp. NPDC090106]|uniref:hypothetical protein n=1 Tax=Streptomyces sp. NPDC090106 TaxID=3365946 RepID=UPI0037F32A90